MRKYKIKIEEVCISEFDTIAKNKKEAKRLVKDIVLNTNILALPYAHHDYEIRLDIKAKEDNNHETNS